MTNPFYTGLNDTGVSYNITDVLPGSNTINQSSKMENIVPNHTEKTDLEIFSEFYKPIHGYLAAIVCVFGVVANILNIIVLTRKNMQTSTNVILTGLAISDGLTMVAYFPYALLMYVIHGTDVSPERDTHEVAIFQMGFAIISVVVHSISIWLTVTLAVFRYVFIRFPRQGSIYCNIEKAKVAVVVVVIVVALVCVPNSVNLHIIKDDWPMPGPQNGTVYWINIRNESDFEKFLSNFNFWIQAILIKLLPCFLLTVFSFLLVSTMRNAEKRRKKLLTKIPVTDGESGATSSGGNASRKHKKSRSNRTTRMLLTVVLLFLLTETPQGVLSVLNGLRSSFFIHIYVPLGDLLDIITLINNGINFVLYCTMSKQFRDTFIKIFLKNILHKEYHRTKAAYVTTQATQATKDSDV